MLERREKLLITGAVILCLIVMVVDLFSGPVDISLRDFFNLCLQQWRHQSLDDKQRTQWSVLMDLRMSRLVATGLAGAMLAAAGVLSQGLFRNALAAPSVLGVTAGASFFAAFFYLLGWSVGSSTNFALASILGSFLILGILQIFFRYYRGSTEMILFMGIALNTIFGALTSFIVMYLVEDYQRAPQIMQWLFGGVADRHWRDCLWTIPLLVASLLASRHLARQLDVLSFGQSTAASLGVMVQRVQFWTVTWISILVGAAVALAGGVSFVGLIVPHLSRLIIGPRQVPLLYFSTINGAILLMAADIVARGARPSAEIPLGIVTALIGGPFFLWLLIERMRTHRV